MTKAVPIEFEGKIYSSKKELAQAFDGASYSCFIDRLQRGYSIKDALQKEYFSCSGWIKRKPTQILVFDKYYTYKELAAKYDIKRETIIARLKNGWSVEQALGLVSPPPFFRNHEGHARNTKYKNTMVIDGISVPKGKNGDFKLYLITNIVNNKQYVGLTCGMLGKRLKQHFNSARRGYKTHLYNAIRFYGENYFKIELIRDDASDYIELQNQEILEIRERDTIKNGYNTAVGGSIGGKSKSIVINNIKFNTIKEASNFFGISNAADRLRKEWTIEEAFGLVPRTKKPKTTKPFEGYSSLIEAAQSNNIKLATVKYRLRNGWTPKQSLGLEPPPRKISLLQIAKDNKIDVRTLKKRINEGKNLENQFISTKQGNFKNLVEAAKYFGIKKSTVFSRINKYNWSINQALELENPPLKKRTRYRGIYYEKTQME